MALMRIYGNRKGARGTFLPTYIFLFQEKRDHIDTIRHFCTIYSVCKGQGSVLHLDTGYTACYIRIPYFNEIRFTYRVHFVSNVVRFIDILVVRLQAVKICSGLYLFPFKVYKIDRR